MKDNSFDNTDTLNSLLGQVDSAKKREMKAQDFLSLMVQQIQNQDKIQAHFNQDFLSQLPQFTAHDRDADMQESLQQMTTSLQSNQALQASALVGRKVLVERDTLLSTENDAKIAIEVLPGYSKMCAFIYTALGEIIKTIHLGSPDPGFFQFNWDGIGDDGNEVKEGKYKVEVYAVYQGKEVSLKTMLLANVDSVSLGKNGEGLKLNVAGIGSVVLDQVKQITV